MHVDKPIDVALLGAELGAAGVPFDGLGYHPTDDTGGGEVYTFTAAGAMLDLPPEAAPVVEAHDASKPARSAAFESQEDRERLRLVAERSRDDPSFAALAELALRKQGG